VLRERVGVGWGIWVARGRGGGRGRLAVVGELLVGRGRREGEGRSGGVGALLGELVLGQLVLGKLLVVLLEGGCWEGVSTCRGRERERVRSRRAGRDQGGVPRCSWACIMGCCGPLAAAA
jgi:hypothetical protein